MRSEDCGLVFIANPHWVILRYFKAYEVLPELLRGKRGAPPVKIGEFIRVTFPNGETHDVHDYITKDQFIPAIKHIYRYPKEGNDENIQGHV